MRNNRTAKFAVIGMCVIAVLLAAGLMLMSLSGNSEVSAENSEEAVAVKAFMVDSSDDSIKEIFGCKVDDVSDSAAVAKLLDAMKVEDVTGEYTVKISTEKGTKVLALNAAEPVQEKDKDIFDNNMKKCAEQMLALMPQIGEVNWSYSLLTADAKEEVISISINEAGANDELDKNVRSYGDSANKFKNLLAEQAGKK